jgi:hypothetical protein
MRRLAIAFAMLALAPCAAAQPDPSFQHPADAPPEQQFDFWLGQWDVRNRFIGEDGTEQVVEAEALIWPALDGQVILEHWRSLSDAWPMRGFSMRSYDPETDLWTIALCWPGEGPARINLMEGRFRNGRGEFFPVNTPDDERPRSRFTFSDVGPNSLRWDMAVPVEGDAREWRTTWVMEWTRRAPEDPIDLTALHGKGASENDELDWLHGEWIGRAGDLAVLTTALDTMKTRRVNNGRAILVQQEVLTPPSLDGDLRGFAMQLHEGAIGLLAWDREAEQWSYVEFHTERGMTRYSGGLEDDRLVLSAPGGHHRILVQRGDRRAAFVWIAQRRLVEADEWIDLGTFPARSPEPLGR